MERTRKFGMPVLLASAAIVTLAVLGIVVQNGGTQIAHAQGTPTPAPTTSAAPRTDIGVTGTGKVTVTPDTAVASIGVDITAPTLADATKQASDKMTAVIAAIKAQGVDPKDIQTTSYNVYPITNQPKENESATITGYHVSNIVTVTIRDITKVGPVLDAAIGAGANSVNSVFFTVNDPSKAMDEARTMAVKEAMAKANTLATAANVKVGAIISISDMSGGVQPFYARDAYVPAPAAAGGAGPVETGSTDITATVEMHFEIAQ